MATQTLNRPKFRMFSRKIKLAVRWCEENGVPVSSIRAISFHGVYGYGQGSRAYVVEWDSEEAGR